MTLATDGRVVIRKMNDSPTDYVLMAKWLSDPAVLEWYEGRDRVFDLKQVKAKFSPRALGQDRVAPCIFELADVAIGYVQFYPLDDAEVIEYGLSRQDVSFGIDLFIGNPALWGRGIGPRVLRALTRHLVRERGATALILDPQVANSRAIRAYEKAGFVKQKLLPGHEFHEGEHRDCWLMVWRLDAPETTEILPGSQPD
ncbi:MAG: GNAT family N-acetyltransferase [Chloroflexi bacterium]|nr:GNAT family N-acetyltransferase [Chloroflexota bacterium]